MARQLIRSVPREQLLEYTGRRRTIFRAAAADAAGRLAEALLVAPPGLLPERDWLLSLLASGNPLSPEDRRALLSGHTPVPLPSVGRIVCSCFNIGVNQLAWAIAGGCATVEDAGKATKAGTNCGSCRSEIGSILQATRLQTNTLERP